MGPFSGSEVWALGLYAHTKGPCKLAALRFGFWVFGIGDLYDDIFVVVLQLHFQAHQVPKEPYTPSPNP